VEGAYGSREPDLAEILFKKFACIATPVCLVLWGFEFVLELLEEWRELGDPYSYIAAFYYFTVVKLFGFASVIAEYTEKVVNTQYENLNTTIFYLLPLLYLSLIGLFGYFLKIKGYLKKVIFIWSLPLVVGVAWYILYTGFLWLFASN
ncbi:hypothetical protein, partial [Candidatus Sororendozoicomonas aggregata]|uniref:hypothetical protein n=1 Tax=Candidatus Sororendozoicomonas aggregata TaxID=3073239 RepID=UPI002ED381BD